MNTLMEQEYRGFKIHFEENRDGEFWVVQIPGDDNIECPTLAIAKKVVDKRIKGDFTRVPCFVKKGWRYSSNYSDKDPDYMEGEISSITPDGDVKVVRKGKKGATNERGGVYAHTPANAVLIGELNALKKEEERIHKLIAKKEDALLEVDLNKLREEQFA